MSFSGIPNSQHCGGFLDHVTIAAVLLHYWLLLCKVKRSPLYFKELLHNYWKYT